MKEEQILGKGHLARGKGKSGLSKLFDCWFNKKQKSCRSAANKRRSAPSEKKQISVYTQCLPLPQDGWIKIRISRQFFFIDCKIQCPWNIIMALSFSLSYQFCPLCTAIIPEINTETDEIVLVYIHCSILNQSIICTVLILQHGLCMHEQPFLKPSGR